MKEHTRSRSAREVQRERLGMDADAPPPFDPTRPADVISQVLKKAGLDDKLWEHNLIAEWEDIVGAQVASHTRPGKQTGNRLTVFVDSSPWLRELQTNFSQMMLDSLQSRFGEKRVGKIVFQLDPDC